MPFLFMRTVDTGHLDMLARSWQSELSQGSLHMGYSAPIPTDWVKTWLKPLFDWLEGLAAAVNIDPLADVAPELISGAHAVSPTIPLTEFTSTGAGNALTLANGSTIGFRKTITHSVKGSGGTGVLTPASAGNFSSATLTNLHDSISLV